jgi:hypothetical protein
MSRIITRPHLIIIIPLASFPKEISGKEENYDTTAYNNDDVKHNKRIVAKEWLLHSCSWCWSDRINGKTKKERNEKQHFKIEKLSGPGAQSLVDKNTILNAI